MPDVFGNPTLQEMTAQRQKAFQGQVGDIMQSNMARASTGAEKAGVGVGSFLGALGAKYLGTPYAETAEGQAVAAREAAVREAMASSPTESRTNQMTPEGGMTTESTPIPQLQQKMNELENIRKYNTMPDMANAASVEYENKLTKEVLELSTAAKESKELTSNVSLLQKQSIPDDLIQGYANGDLTYKDVLDTHATRTKPEDAYVPLTPEQALDRGLNPETDYQLNTKDNKVSVIGGGGTTVNVGQKDPVKDWNTTLDNYRQDTKSIIEDADKVSKLKAALRAEGSSGTIATQQSVSSLFGDSQQAQAELQKWAKLGNLGERVSGSITKFFSGTYTPEALNDISRLVESYEDNLNKRQSAVNDKYTRISSNFGINPKDVIVEPVMSPRYDFNTMPVADLVKVDTQDLLPHQLQDFSERAAKLREQIEQGRTQ